MAVTFDSTERIVPGTSVDLLGESAYTFAFWFRISSSESNETNAFIYSEESAFNELVFIFIADIAGQGRDGELFFQHRSPTGDAQIATTGTYNDDVWHRAVIVRSASNSHTVYVDGASDGSSATETSTSTVSPIRRIGNNTENDTSGFNGDLGRMALWLSALTVEQADHFLWTGQCAVTPEWYVELEDASAVRDLSGNGNSMTISGTLGQADHVPAMPAFGRTEEFPFVTAAAVSGSPWNYYAQL